VPRGSFSQNILAYLVVLCFEEQRPKQNTVAHLKSNISPNKNFVLATPLVVLPEKDPIELNCGRKRVAWTHKRTIHNTTRFFS